MKTLDWYFDFISPYSYLQSTVLPRIERHAVVHRRPILFAGLLDHYGQLGPAEIPEKRIWTFRNCVWLAERHGIPINMPTMHPFNPLPLLRLSIALGNRPDGVDRLFRFVWVDGHVPGDHAAWHALLDEVGVEEGVLATADVKAALRANGDAALAAGVFGVPTAVVDGATFWGFEATDMLIGYLDGAPVFDGAAMKGANALPVGPMRPGATRGRGEH